MCIRDRPGVGAFADAMAKLEATGLVPVIKQEVEHKPLLGKMCIRDSFFPAFLMNNQG